jgi:hypothetical protein
MLKWIVFGVLIFSLNCFLGAIDVNPSKERLQPERGPRPYLFQGDPRRVERANSVQLRDVSLLLRVDPEIVRAGSQVIVNLSVLNRSRRPLMLLFPDSQRLEIAVVNQDGEEVFLLSNRTKFEAIPGTTVINPRERAVFGISLPVSGWNGGTKPGRYRVVGAVAGYLHLQASAYIEVR